MSFDIYDNNNELIGIVLTNFERVTHCKDCLYYNCNVKFPVCDFHEINVDESNYCSWAKRKDEEE